MKKPKIAVYAIAKNEAHNVQGWCDSNKDADYRVVLDTGSTDETVKLLEKNGIIVFNTSYDKFSYADAKNDALGLVPDDIDVCISQDMDERWLDGWRDEIESNFEEDVTFYDHRYRNNGGAWINHNKIHKRSNCKWVGIIHETLEFDILEKRKYINAYMDEWQDLDKDRSFYLDLLIQKIADGDNDWRTFCFLGSEYLNRGEFENAVASYKNSFDVLEDGFLRCYVAKIIASIYEHFDVDQATVWYKKAISLGNQRETFYCAAKFYQHQQMWLDCKWAAIDCLEVKDKPTGFTYVEDAWSDDIYDTLALSCYYSEDYDNAYKYGIIAAEKFPNIETIQSNLYYYRMKKPIKIAVYTVALNEEQFVERWHQTALSADYLLIADTGSTDRTVELAKQFGINVISIGIKPWRFDDARNAALAAIPLDIDYCISLDMDEILVGDWRETLQKCFAEGITRPIYKHIWSFNPDGSPGAEFAYDHIHARKGYRWKHPVHECVVTSGIDEVRQFVTGIETHHYPDHSKSRGQYLPLLKMSVQEDPWSDRNAHYYARELMYYGRNEEATAEFKRHLALPTALWDAERAASMRYLGKVDHENAVEWLEKAVLEAPGRREPLADLAQHYYDKGDWKNCYESAKRCLAITEKPLEYLNDQDAWNWRPWHLLAIAAYYIGEYKEACEAGTTAFEMDRENGLLRSNLDDWYYPAYQRMLEGKG